MQPGLCDIYITDVVVTLHCAHMEMLCRHPLPRWGLIGLAHHCIWKIKPCCSMEQAARTTGCGTAAQGGQKLGRRKQEVTFRVEQRGSRLRIEKLNSHPCERRDFDGHPTSVCLCFWIFAGSSFQCDKRQ